MTSALYASLLQARASERLNLALTLVINDRTFTPTAGTDPLTLTVDAIDLVRSVTGRRTRAEVGAYSWSGDPSRLLDNGFTQYGPFRSEG